MVGKSLFDVGRRADLPYPIRQRMSSLEGTRQRGGPGRGSWWKYHEDAHTRFHSVTIHPRRFWNAM
jgi:hypothetical protein